MRAIQANPACYWALMFAAVAGGCARGAPHWTPEEKENASHIFRSAEADIKATRIMNRLGTFQIPDSIFEVVTELQRKALEEARMVREEVLEKAAPGMARPYQDYYKRSLELRLVHAENGDNISSIQASQLHDRWVDWSRAHPPRVPK